MVAEKLKLWWFHGRQKKKLKPPGAQAGPSSLRFGLNEIQVIKIKKYERFIMKSDIGDILAQFGSFFGIEYVYAIM